MTNLLSAPPAAVGLWKRGVAVACWLVASATAQLPAGEQTPAFRGGTDVVPIYATVRSRDGHLVTNLPREAFHVFEDGRPVELSVFSNERQPLALVVMLDVSGGFIDHGKYDRVRAAMLTLIDALESHDRMRIGTFSEPEIAVSAHFTSSRAELTRVMLEEFWPGSGGRPLWNAIAAGMTSLSDEPGRHVVLILTDGANTAATKRLPDLRAVTTKALADNVMICAVTFASAPYVRSGGSDLSDDDPRALDQLTTRTGGGQFSAVTAGNLSNALSGVLEELRSQYLLGFVPARLDGKTHKIQMRVDGEGLIVRARTDYVARGLTAP